jgi:hypothetical protein
VLCIWKWNLIYSKWIEQYLFDYKIQPNECISKWRICLVFLAKILPPESGSGWENSFYSSKNSQVVSALVSGTSPKFSGSWTGDRPQQFTLIIYFILILLFLIRSYSKTLKLYLIFRINLIDFAVNKWKFYFKSNTCETQVKYIWFFFCHSSKFYQTPRLWSKWICLITLKYRCDNNLAFTSNFPGINWNDVPIDWVNDA